MADEARPGDAGGQGSLTPGGEVVKPFELDEAPAPPPPLSAAAPGSAGGEFAKPALAREGVSAAAAVEPANAFVRAEPAAPAEVELDLHEEFISPPGGVPRGVVIGFGVVLALSAAFLGAYNMGPMQIDTGTGVGLGAEATGLHRAARVFVVLAAAAIHTGTGLVALGVACKFLGCKLGPLGLAAARVFVAVSAFLAVICLSIPVPWVGGVIKALLAGGAYWGIVFLFFGHRVDRANVVLGLHAGIAGVLYLHMWVWAWVMPFVVR